MTLGKGVMDGLERTSYLLGLRTYGCRREGVVIGVDPPTWVHLLCAEEHNGVVPADRAPLE